MILQALSDYYDRKKNEPDGNIAPKGWEWKELPFIIVLSGCGDLIQIEDTREGEGKNRRGKRFLVPIGVERTSGIAPNLLWDSAEYIFGLGKKGQEKKKAFLERLKIELSGLEIIQCIINFLENCSEMQLSMEANWIEISDKKPFLSFRMVNDQTLICRYPEVAERLSSSSCGDFNEGVCLVTGERTGIKKLHKTIKGVRGTKSTGGNIVSFNHKAFESYNKENGYNAPVSDKIEFAYTTALNSLLSWDSNQRMAIADTTAVFWSEKKTSFESDFSYFFTDYGNDNTETSVEKIKTLFESVKTGAYINDNDNVRFYLLGLAPNSARIAISFWQVGTISEFAKRIKEYFDDFSITKPKSEPEFYSFWRITVNASAQNKIENLPPEISGDLMRAILTGTPYPATLFQAVIRRIRSDTANRVTSVRAATIKAYINRYYRFYPNKNVKEINMTLDEFQPSKGYQLGRLFATLEKIQEEANPKLNTTIRERFYGAACSSPVTVFSNLLRLKNYHLAKLENRGRVVQFEKLLAEIMSKLTDFPSYLDFHEQGRFAIGYYHQRNKFYTKKDKDGIISEPQNENIEGSEEE